MLRHHKSGITIIKSFTPIGKMMPCWDSYALAGEGIVAPVTKASVESFITRTAGHFLAQYAAGDTFADVYCYRDCVVGSICIFEDENGDCHVLGGSAVIAMCVLLMTSLQQRLAEPVVLAMLLAGLNRDNVSGRRQDDWVELASLASGQRDEKGGSAEIDRWLTDRGELEMCLPPSIRDESLLCFARWIMSKGLVAETLATTPAAKEMVLKALRSGETHFL